MFIAHIKEDRKGIVGLFYIRTLLGQTFLTQPLIYAGIDLLAQRLS
jgi:hypothetical protein